MLHSFLKSSEHIFILIIDILGVFFTFWVYFGKKRDKVNKGLCLMVLAILSWITFYYLASVPDSQTVSLLLFRISGGSVFLFFVAYYYFIIRWFLGKRGVYNIVGKIILIYGLLLFAFTLFSNYIIVSPKFDANGVIFPLFSLLGASAFYGFVIILTALINVVLLKNYFSSNTKNKLKIQYFLIGMLLFATLNFIFNVILPVLGKNYSYYQIGNYSTMFLLGFTSYAVVRQRLFGIRVVFTQMLVGVMAILLFVNVLGSASVFDYLWKGGLFIAFLIFGWLLVKSIVREIKQKEELDQLANQLATTNIHLEAAYRKLQKLDKAKSEFVSISSHQLRTPLTAIKGYISMMIEGDYGHLPEEAIQPLKNVYASNERLIKLVNSLLNVSRIEAGKIKFSPSKFSIEEFIKDVVAEFKPRAQERDLYFKFHQPPADLTKEITADQQKLRQVLSNLYDNAIKYTPTGGIETFLEKGKAKDILRIIIKDTGEGLAEDEKGKLFQSFSRATAGQRLWIEGAGLGLYVAKKFIDMHQGRIWAESQGKGKGSRFIIDLPIDQPLQAEEPADTATTNPAESEPAESADG